MTIKRGSMEMFNQLLTQEAFRYILFVEGSRSRVAPGYARDILGPQGSLPFQRAFPDDLNGGREWKR